MQMVNCGKCGKPIEHIHKYKIVSGETFEKVIQHINCDDPLLLRYVTDCVPDKRTAKELPAFAYEAPQKRSV